MIQYLHQPRAHKDPIGTTKVQCLFLSSWSRLNTHNPLSTHPSEQATFLFCEVKKAPPNVIAPTPITQKIEKRLFPVLGLSTNLNIDTHSGILESNKQCIFQGRSLTEPIKGSLWLGLDQT